MNFKKLARNGVVVLLVGTLSISGCTTAQLQKKHTSFDGCFREEKKTAMLLGSLPGLILGLGAASRGDPKGTVAAAAIAVLGAIIGNRIAWQSCLEAFPVKSQTSVINDRATTIANSGLSVTQANEKTLVVQNVSVGPLIFGKDLDVNVTYKFVSDNPASRDVKAKVSRNLLFKGPDGAQQEVASSTEDTIQQGVSRAKFAIPTPSLEDSKELESTTNWAFKFVVEVDGMRHEQVVALYVPQLNQGVPPAPASESKEIAPTATIVPPQPAVSNETIRLKAGTRLVGAANSTVVVTRLAKELSVTVLQRTVEGKFNWVQVRLPDGKEGWFRGAPR